MIILKSNFNIGERLRQIRVNRSLSQEQVANIADVTASYYGQIERGTKNVTVSTLEKICNALDIPLAEFFSIKQNGQHDDISSEILYQLNGKSESEKQTILQVIKLFFLHK